MLEAGSSTPPYIYIGGSTTASTSSCGAKNSQNSFCYGCADWIIEEGWQDDGRYFCWTCLEFSTVDLDWKPDSSSLNS